MARKHEQQTPTLSGYRGVSIVYANLLERFRHCDHITPPAFLIRVIPDNDVGGLAQRLKGVKGPYFN